MSSPDVFTNTDEKMSNIQSQNKLLPGSENSSEPEMDDLINPHWQNFGKASITLHLTFGLFCFVVGVLGIAGNATVIYVFLKTKRLRSSSNTLIVNLAICDLCMMAIMCPMYFLSSIHRKWIFGKNGCRFYGFSGALFGTASIITMAGIALDRYVAICKPFTTSRDTTKGRRAKMIIIFVWAYSIGWATPPLFGINNYVLEGFLTTCSFDYLDSSTTSHAFILAMCIGAYVAPLLLIAGAYGRITWTVYTHSRRFRGSMTSSISNESILSLRMRREFGTAKTTLTVVVCWTVAWSPYAVIALLGITSYTSALTPLAAQLPAIFAKTAAFYNPFVYALTHPRYREALRIRLLNLIGHSESFSLSESRSRSTTTSFGLREWPMSSTRLGRYEDRLCRKLDVTTETVPMSGLLLPSSDDPPIFQLD